jgi:hypothetical protein
MTLAAWNNLFAYRNPTLQCLQPLGIAGHYVKELACCVDFDAKIRGVGCVLIV